MKSFSQRKLGILFFIIFTLCIYIFSWFTRDKNHSYTLYRNSVSDNNMRIHVTTFDAADNGKTYNEENCKITRDLFKNQDGVKTMFWCEKGHYNKVRQMFNPDWWDYD